MTIIYPDSSLNCVILLDSPLISIESKRYSRLLFDAITVLTIYHSNHLDVLKDLLVAMIQRHPPTSVLQQEQILVQSPGMAQWLRLELAKGLGIAAGFEFPLPASFLWKMYTQVLPDVPQRSAFNKEAMSWKLMTLLPQFRDHSAFSALSHYLANDSDDIRAFQLAEKIADIFDQYLVYRPDWIRAWERNETISEIDDDSQWQPILWRALVAQTAALQQSPWHRANMHHRFAETLTDVHFDVARCQLPKRLFVFGISALPPHFVDSLTVLAQHCDIHLLAHNPAQLYWGDERDPKYLRKIANTKLLQQGSLQPSDKGWFEAEAALEALNSIGHPLLGSMGKLGRDYFHQLYDLGANEIDLFIEDQPDTLLGQLQKDIFNLTDHSAAGAQISRNTDTSLQLHSCHSPLREVETLHDRLLDLFDQDPTLTPKDIVVMLPDIDRYTPWIQAVFGSIDGAQRLPYAISDLSAKSEHPLLAALLMLLNLDANRCTAPELMALLEVPAIQQRFHISDADLGTLRQWTLASGIRWGLTPSHQAQFNLPPMHANSWLFGIRRMLLGYAMPESSGVYDDILPLDFVQGMSASLAGELASFISALVELVEALPQQRSVEQWHGFMHQLLERFFVIESDEDTVALSLIHKTLNQLQEQLEAAHYLQPLSRAIFSSYLTERLTAARSSQRFLAGQINFCTLMPMRSIPFKVVCLLGMNDGDYPRSIAPIGFDLIAKHGRRGDRSRREDDRYLFLEALLSAQQTLYISFIGRQIKDNRERIPSVLVTELLNYCEQGYGLSPQQLITQHPLQAFSPELFSDDQTLFSYRHEWLATAHREARTAIDFISTELEPLSDFGAVPLELNELLRFYHSPCRYFFNQRLKVYFNAEDETLEEMESFELDHLSQYQLKEQLLSSQLQQEPRQDFNARMQASGAMPHAAFGELLLADQYEALEPMAQELLPLMQLARDDVEVNITLALPEAERGTLQLTGWLNGMTQRGMVRYRPSKLKGKDLIRYWIEHLCLCIMSAEQNDIVPKTHIVDTEKCWRLPALSAESAVQYLTAVVSGFYLGQQKPLPWFTETAYQWIVAAVDNNADKAKAKALSTFEGDSFHIHGEGKDAYIQRAYPELEPVWDEMVALTEHFLKPATLHLQEVTA